MIKIGYPLLLASLGLISSTASGKPLVEILDQGRLVYEGETLQAIDGEGVYFVNEKDHEGTPMPSFRGDLRPKLGDLDAFSPVRLELVDFVDCSETSHDFTQSDRGKSRVLDIHGNSYRVTGAPSGFDLFWFAYHVKTKPSPGTAHLLVVETVNDQERYTGVEITHPRDRGKWAPPYEEEPLCPIEGREWGHCMDFCQEPDCFHPDVGVTSYTGREYILDQQPYNIYQVFYPKMDPVKVTISSSGWYLNWSPDRGGAASRIWVYRFADPIESRLPVMTPPLEGKERNVGIYMTHPWYFYAHYGIPARLREQRELSLRIMLDTMAFAGFNWIEFNAINGSDRSGIAWYESKYFPQLCGNLLTELPPLAEERGIGLVPVITSLRLNDPPKEVHGIVFNDESFQMGANGAYTMAFNNRAPDPLRPEVQEYLLAILKEIAENVADQPSVKGIGFRVNGKIGLCYQAHQDGLRGAKESGYSRWNIGQFNEATGSSVPTEPGRAYPWLRERPDMWDKWIDYRCEKTRDFWLAARDLIRTYRSDWNLYVKMVLPSEIPGTNIEWVNEGIDSVELLKHHGYDPSLFHEEEGIVLQRAMMEDADRFFVRVRWGPPWGSNHEAYSRFHYQPILPRITRSLAGSAVEIYHNYWEESFHPEWEFGDMRTNTATGPGRSFYRPAIFSLMHSNVDTIAFMGWERPILNHEHTLRAFSQAFRALPRTEPRPFEGRVEPANPSIVARWYGDRLGIINDSIFSEPVNMIFPSPIPVGTRVRDVATGTICLPAEGGNRSRLEFWMEPWSLRTLVFEKEKSEE